MKIEVDLKTLIEAEHARIIKNLYKEHPSSSLFSIKEILEAMELKEVEEDE